MMMTNDKRDDVDLEAYFEAGRQTSVMPSSDLLARVMADAEAQVAKQSPVPTTQAGFLSVLWSAIGGWPAAAGMATATLVGVWIGFSQPVGLDQIADSYLGYGTDSYLVDLVPAFGDGFGEG